MLKKSANNVAQSLRRLCGHNQLVLRLFERLSTRKNNASSTPLSQVCNALDLTMKEAVALARLLEEIGCGKYVVGRLGNPTRIVWYFTTISLCQVALGQSHELVAAAGFDDESDQDIELTPQDTIESVAAPGPAVSSEQHGRLEAHSYPTATAGLALSLQDAKKALALYYNIPVENVEITIKG